MKDSLDFFLKFALIFFALLLTMMIVMTGCTKGYDEYQPNLGHDFELDMRLGNPDSNGYYHLQLSNEWQTLHRISGSVSPVENDDDPGHIGIFFAIVLSFYINMLKLYLN